IIAVDTPSNLSRIFEDNSAISVTAVGKEEEISNIIKSIDGITLFEAEGRENDAIRYRIEYKRENDLRGVISTSLAGKGYPILELRSLDRSLEDIFIKLVSEKTGGK
ncbi:MAG: ABC transporter, partial [Bacillota bacterium]|nr:ABC transporter [Bacillota bacterium]